jgi:hypothetical protein
MRRKIVYPGQVPMETDILDTNKHAMIAMAKLASAVLGTATVVSGLAVSATAPPALNVSVAPGEIYSLVNIDNTAYGSLAADTAHQILKQGISLDAVILACAAPATAGQSVNYLIQASFNEVDGGTVVLPYYNASNPATAYSGPNNTGVAQATSRQGLVSISAKSGASATTGTQITPAPDAGFVGLCVVTVANGQTTITGANISVLSTAPLINSSLLGTAPVFTTPPVVPPATAANQAAQLGQVAALIGTMSGAKMYLSSASATANFTAEQIVVGTSLTGLPYLLSNYSKTVNLATVGAGGMDTGSAPASGYVALHAIYNPTTGLSSILASDATSVAASTVYGGAHMPAGYTASALISVVPTDGSGNIKQLSQIGRSIAIVISTALSSNGGATTPTMLSIAPIVPKNAKSVIGSMSIGGNASGSVQLQLSTDANLVGNQIAFISTNASGGANVSNNYQLTLNAPQTLFYSVLVTGAVSIASFVTYISSYTF